MRIYRPFKNHGGTLHNADTIVVHAIGEYIDSEGPDMHCLEFLDKLGYSYHRVIDTSGDVIESVDVHNMAWHCKKNKGNFRSIGVAFMVQGLHDITSLTKALRRGDALTLEQLESGIEECQRIISLRPTITDMVRHSDWDSRKPDFPEDAFDFGAFKSDVFQE